MLLYQNFPVSWDCALPYVPHCGGGIIEDHMILSGHVSRYCVGPGLLIQNGGGDFLDRLQAWILLTTWESYLAQIQESSKDKYWAAPGAVVFW